MLAPRRAVSSGSPRERRGPRWLRWLCWLMSRFPRPLFSLSSRSGQRSPLRRPVPDQRRSVQSSLSAERAVRAPEKAAKPRLRRHAEPSQMPRRSRLPSYVTARHTACTTLTCTCTRTLRHECRPECAGASTIDVAGGNLSGIFTITPGWIDLCQSCPLPSALWFKWHRGAVVCSVSPRSRHATR
jgi:hypothetical protein